MRGKSGHQWKTDWVTFLSQKNTGLVFNCYNVRRKLLRSGRVKKVNVLKGINWLNLTIQGEKWSCCLHGCSVGVHCSWGCKLFHADSCHAQIELSPHFLLWWKDKHPIAVRILALHNLPFFKLMEIAGNGAEALKMKTIKPRHIRVCN